MIKCFLLLGTNIGDKNNNLLQARTLISEKVGDIIHASAVYQTSAWGKEDQDDFLNQVLEIETGQSPENLLYTCLAIEKDLGRVRFERWGERLIDVDILYYATDIVSLDNLSIPHPEIQNRRFTLVPLVELAPEYMHPKLNKSNQELLEACLDPLEVVKCD